MIMGGSTTSYFLTLALVGNVLRLEDTLNAKTMKCHISEERSSKEQKEGHKTRHLTSLQSTRRDMTHLHRDP